MTYSIVARDPQTGELGVAVQTHWFAVGRVCPWARPGVGAVATQASALAAYGPRALDLMAAGVSAGDALKQLLAADEAAATRQVAVIDANGKVAVHTGAHCVADAGHAVGDQFCCQANIMASPTVWGAMHDAFAGAAGTPLPQRLLVALGAAQDEGGDIRGRQSAALIVVPPSGEPWDTTVSVRVDDHHDPLAELERLLRVDQAYRLAEEGELQMGYGNDVAAAAAYGRALELDPHNHELMFWGGLGLIQGGDLDGGVAKVQSAINLHPGWRIVLERLPPEFVPAAATVAARLSA